MRTTEQIIDEMQGVLGFVPPFFAPAQNNSQVLENLWQQTLLAYLNNPYSALFKEKLSAYLSRFCVVPYCMICHSCSLRPLGVQAAEVLALLEAPIPTEAQAEHHLRQLTTQFATGASLSVTNPDLEDSLLSCAIFIAVDSSQTEYYRHELRQLLGSTDYEHLIALITYIKTCHHWMEVHPETAYSDDERVRTHLSGLLADEPKLAVFFEEYVDRIRQERQDWEQQRVRLAERKRAQQALQQSSERLTLALEAANMLAWDWRFPTNQISWSGNAQPLLGELLGDALDLENCTYATFLNWVHPDDRRSVHRALLNLLKGTIEQEVEFRLLTRDGTVRWLAGRGKTLRNETGRAVRILGTAMDITRRKQTEEKIRQQADLLDITSDAVMVRDLKQNILFWNKGAERLYGWSPEEILGKNATEVLYQEGLPALLKIQKTLLQQSEWRGELHQLDRHGKEVIVDSRWTLAQAEGEQFILVVNTDITEKKQLEGQFLRAQRLESLGTLASGIAHDLNNVLAPVLMSVQLLEKKLPDQQSQWLLNLLETNTRRGADLVKQVLSFARGLDGKRTLLQVGKLVADIEQIIRETFPKSIKLQLSMPEAGLWSVSGDATQLHQVLMNLCVNARDAMLDGGILKISVENSCLDDDTARIHWEAKPGSYVVISVADTGMGIKPEVLDRMFEPFFTTKETGQGTGLGLSTVLGIVKSHGGFIQVESQVGQGTSFKVYLPALYAELTPAIMPAPQLMRGNGELILVVDDEEPIRQVTTTFLESYGYRVITAPDGIEAIAVYAMRRTEISMLLVDMIMPTMDGPTTVRTLQKMDPHIKILGMSGLSSSQEIAATTNARLKTVLPKPFSAEDLLQHLQQVLQAPVLTE